MSQKPKFRISIPMLNAYDHYVNYGEDELAFNTPDLIDFINFGKEFRTEKEINLENIAAELKNKLFSGNFLNEIAVAQAAFFMPGIGTDNIFCSTIFEDVEIFGTLDFLGFGSGISFVASNYYQLNDYFSANTNWFLKSIKDKGADSLTYIILLPGKGEDIHARVTRETFHFHNYDFSTLEQKVIGLRSFIEDHKSLIINKKIFIDEPGAIVANTPADSKGASNG